MPASRKSLSTLPFLGVMMLAAIVGALGGVGGFNDVQVLTAQGATQVSSSSAVDPAGTQHEARISEVTVSGREVAISGELRSEADEVDVRVALRDGTRGVRTGTITVEPDSGTRATRFRISGTWTGQTPTKLTAIAQVSGNGTTEQYRTRLG